MRIMAALTRVRAGAGLLMSVQGLSPEEKQVAKRLLPLFTPRWRAAIYYYRLVRYAGYCRLIALKRAIYWAC
jgi:hypothetical protein